MTTSKIMVSSQAPGLSCVSSHLYLTNHRLSLVPKVLRDITPGRSVQVLVSNFGHTIIELPKNISTAVATDPPNKVVRLGQNATGLARNGDREPSNDEETVTEVNYMRNTGRRIKILVPRTST